MRFQLGLVILAIWMVLLSGAGQAQTSGVAQGKTILGQTSGGVAEGKSIPGDVTFQVPLNLTRLSPYVSNVAVTCMFGPRIDPNMDMTSQGKDVLSNRVELPVSAGQVVTTARVVIAVPSTPPYKPGQVLNYECALSALSADPKAGSGWQRLDQKAPVASLQVSPSPLPIKGTFTW